MDALPPEILHKVLVDADKPTLRACSLACRASRYPSQRLLLRRLSVRGPSEFDQPQVHDGIKLRTVERRLTEMPHLAAMVQTLVLGVSPSWKPKDLERVKLLIGATSAVKEIVLVGPMPSTAAVDILLNAMASCQRLDRVTVQMIGTSPRFLFGLLGIAEILEIDGFGSYEPNRDVVPEFTPPSAVKETTRLRYLTCYGCPQEHALLSQHPFSARLSALKSLSCVISADLDGTLLRACSSTIQSLRLQSGSIPPEAHVTIPSRLPSLSSVELPIIWAQLSQPWLPPLLVALLNATTSDIRITLQPLGGPFDLRPISILDMLLVDESRSGRATLVITPLSPATGYCEEIEKALMETLPRAWKRGLVVVE
ncbi:hypothetical protein MKEN_01336800 [Mycena kentingensis (nom. inval.)]|nr:hypothetical protein MKEN_01336800 [Mycena kentingensis (nom. inval.)]